MANQNCILIVARDSQDSVISYDGNNWVAKKLPETQSWRFINGVTGKSAFSYLDNKVKASTIAFTTSDGSTWKNGTLPINKETCIVAIARDSERVYTSFNGSEFSLVLPRVTYYQTCSVKCVSNSIADYINVNFIREIVCLAVSTGNAVKTLKSTFRRTMATVVTSMSDKLLRSNAE